MPINSMDVGSQQTDKKDILIRGIKIIETSPDPFQYYFISNTLMYLLSKMCFKN